MSVAGTLKDGKVDTICSWEADQIREDVRICKLRSAFEVFVKISEVVTIIEKGKNMKILTINDFIEVSGGAREARKRAQAQRNKLYGKRDRKRINCVAATGASIAVGYVNPIAGIAAGTAVAAVCY